MTPSPPGISVVFDAVVDNVAVHVNARSDWSRPPSTPTCRSGSFNVGPVYIANPMFHLHLNPTTPIQIGFSGGISAGNYSLMAAVSLALGNTANGASRSAFSVTGGLPYWLEASGTITGSIYGDG